MTAKTSSSQFKQYSRRALKPLAVGILTVLFVKSAVIADSTTETQGGGLLVATGVKSTTTKPATVTSTFTAKATNQSTAGYVLAQTSLEKDPTMGSTGRPAGLVDLVMPMQVVSVAGRFGEQRPNTKAGAPEGAQRPHSGLDLVPADPNTSLIAAADGVVSSNHIGAGNVVMVTRSNGDVYKYMHMKNPTVVPDNTPVTAGSVLGFVGMSGTSHIHLHLTYGVSDPLRQRNVYLGRVSNPIEGMGRIGEGKDGIKYVTDPTPYLPQDIAITHSAGNMPSIGVLGGTIRQQFNLLYGTKLPVGSGATTLKYPSPQFMIPANSNLTDAQIAQARQQIAEGRDTAVANGTMTEAQAQSGVVTPQQLSSILSRTDGFGDTASVPIDNSVETLSPLAMIDNIATSRFGNPDWEANNMRLSSLGLWTEYLHMKAASIYMDRQIMKRRERIEALLASYASQKMQRMQGKVTLLQQTAQGVTVPAMVNLALQGTPDTVLPAGPNMNTPANPVADETTPAINNPSSPCANKIVPSGKPTAGWRADYAGAIIQAAQQLNANPNDLAAIISFETGGLMTPSRTNSIGATGLIQFMPQTATAMGTTTAALRAMSFNDQMQWVVKFFINFKHLDVSKPNSVADLYSLVAGYGYRRPSKAYMMNQLWDANGDGYISKGEAVQACQFKDHQRLFIQ